MFDIGQLHVTENESGVRFPAALWSVAAALKALAGMPGFAAAFPDARTATRRDIQEARTLGLPESLVPFACESQPAHTDYYCCGPESGPAVAVFAVHAVVADWPSFQSFVEWMRHQVTEQGNAEPKVAPDCGGIT